MQNEYLILATDVSYPETGGAKAAGLLFDGWTAHSEIAQQVVRLETVEPYVPGRFYERELPCLTALLDEVRPVPELIIIDGYVTLGSEQEPGLGMHLFQALGGLVPIVGVAKTYFKGTPDQVQVRRGQSRQPLYVTAVGISLQDAREGVSSMHGEFRLPTLLQRVDHLCRQDSGHV